MEFEDSVVLAAPRAAVWEFFLDPYELGECLPGVEKVEVFEPDRVFGGVATLNVAGGSVQLPARVEWLEREAMHGGRLRAMTKVAGLSVAGDGVIELKDTPEGGTHLSWTAGVVVPPAIGDNPILLQVARGVVTQFINAFFECIRAKLEAV